MKNQFREKHLLSILNGYEKENMPLDLYLRHYFRKNRAVGSHDRKEICEVIYGMTRWRGKLDGVISAPYTWEKRYAAYLEGKEPENLPLHVEVSFPKNIFNYLKKAYGEEKARALCLISNREAPTAIRTNRIKISRDALFAKLQKHAEVALSEESEDAIIFLKKVNFFALSEFKEGLFEVQDTSSQRVSMFFGVQKGEQVLDYCAGAGGKTLAFAPKMEGSGQIYLHDIRKQALLEAKKRLKRAGIENAQLFFSDSKKGKLLQGKMDRVLVDAPCSGSGTLRRNPDMKWRFDIQNLPRLIAEQQEIFRKALSFVRKGGIIAYATCSIFPDENGEQVNYFLKNFDLELTEDPLQIFPDVGKGDGFFAAKFKKR